MLALDYPTSIVDAKSFEWQLRDVEPRNKLKIEDGLVTRGTFRLPASGSMVAPLPNLYDPTQYLGFYCVVAKKTLITVTRSPSTTSNYLYVYGTDSSTEGVHAGHLSFQEKNITGISIANGDSSATNLVTWFMFQMPNLALESSWKDGVQTLGVIP